MNIKGFVESDEGRLIDAKDDCVFGDLDYDLTFDVNLDKNGKYVFNLNQDTRFEFDQADIKYTATDYDETNWSILSYRIYETTRLSWLLMYLNDASPKTDNLFTIPKAGTIIKYLDKEKVNDLVDELISMNK